MAGGVDGVVVALTLSVRQLLAGTTPSLLGGIDRETPLALGRCRRGRALGAFQLTVDIGET